MTPVKLACLDLAGTTIGDIDMVERAFAEAIATQGIVPGTSAYARAMVHVHRSRGCPKIEVFRGIFPGNEAQAQAANLTFERSYEGAGAAFDCVNPRFFDATELDPGGYRAFDLRERA